MGPRYRRLLADRATPLAGVFLALTRRCPLACAHCSTRSGPSLPDSPLLPHLERFVRSMATASAPPRHVLLTGGEPLLHPALVHELAITAGGWGAATHAITGGFFARHAAIPAAILRAVEPLATLTVSWDRFHEEFVSLPQLVRAVTTLQARGPEVILHVTRAAPDDPVVERVRAALPDVPIFSASIVDNGRAAELAPIATAPPTADHPCQVASWPVVSYTGAIVACCNQAAVDAEVDAVPPHLALGDLRHDDWSTIAERRRGSRALAALETLGPVALGAAASERQCHACLGADAAPVVIASERLVTAVRALRRVAWARRIQ